MQLYNIYYYLVYIN